MALMRGVLGDTEVAAVVAVTPRGAVKLVAILATPEVIVQEIRLAEGQDQRDGHPDGLWPAKVGDYDIQVLVDLGTQPPRPLAILATPWIEQHLLLYARTLWRRR